MKKVIIANYRYYISGGPEVYMFKFMDSCGKIGYTPIPFSVNYSKNRKTEYSKYFISSRSGDSVYYNQIKKTPKSILRTLSGAFYNCETVKNLNALIDDENPSVLYALQVVNTLSPSIFRAAKKKGLKVVHRISDFNLICPRSDFLLGEDVCEQCIHGGLNCGIKNRCFHGSLAASLVRCESMKFHRRHFLYRYVDYFVTPTEFTRNKLIEGGFDPSKVVKIPTFIDAVNIEPHYSNEGYLLFLGRLVPEKGVKYAIKALTYLTKYPDLKLKVTGTLSENDTEITEIICENGLEDRVEFVGFRSGKDLEELISNCICLLCPAIWYENMPNTVLEAYAYGKPVIASNIGCFPELICEDKTGFLFEPKNAADLAAKIEKMMEPHVAETMGRMAREYVITEYSPEYHFEKLKKLFEE